MDILQAFQIQQEELAKKAHRYEIDYPFAAQIAEYKKHIEDFFRNNKAVLVEYEGSVVDVFKTMEEIRHNFYALNQIYQDIRVLVIDLEKRIKWTKLQLKVEVNNENRN